MEEVKFYDWEDEVESNESSFFEGPEGDYDFEIVSTSKTTAKGSYEGAKQINITFEVSQNGKNKSLKTEGIILANKFDWKINGLFKSIGDAKKENGKYAMHWNDLQGKKGRFHIKQNGEYWNIDKFYEKAKDVEDMPWD